MSTTNKNSATKPSKTHSQKQKESDAVNHSERKSEIFNVVNYIKFAILLGTTFSGVYWGIMEFEDRLTVKIRQSVNDAIDLRLNSSLNMLEEHGTDITLLKMAANKTEAYISDNGYRLNYHERFMRDIAGYLHNKPPHDFIRPEDIRFEDFKENKN